MTSFSPSPPPDVPDLPPHRLNHMIETALMMKQERRAPVSVLTFLGSTLTTLAFAGNFSFSGRAICASLILGGIVMVGMPSVSSVSALDVNQTAAELNDLLFYEMMDPAADEV